MRKATEGEAKSKEDSKFNRKSLNGVPADLVMSHTSFKESDADVIRLQRMIKEEGLEHVEEVRLP